MLHQMTWPTQSPNLNIFEIVGDELDHRMKGKQPTSAQHMWEHISNSVGKAFQVKLVVRMLRVCKADIKGKGNFEESQIYFHLFNTFLVTT